MQGEFSFAWRKRSRTRDAPTPTNISTQSEPEIDRKGTPASPAMALARSVLPVPGGPISSTPRGMRPPSLENFEGFFRNSTISPTSSFASSTPATSEKVVFTLSAVMKRARLLPNERMFPGPPLARIWRKKKYQATSRMMTQGTIDMSSWARKGSRLLYWNLAAGILDLISSKPLLST